MKKQDSSHGCCILSCSLCASGIPAETGQTSRFREELKITSGRSDRGGGNKTAARSSPLEKTTVLQVVLNDDIGDGVKDKLHVLRVGGTREVRVDLLGVFLLVQILKLGLNVAGRLVELVGACEVARGQ